MIPALPGLWMQNGFGDGLEMGCRGCSKAGLRRREFFALQERRDILLVSVGPSCLIQSWVQI